MNDKKGISVRKLAALERAKALGLELKSPEISVLERQAREWKHREHAEKAELPSEKHNPQSSTQDPVSSIKHRASSIQHPASSTNQVFDWQPYRPEQGTSEVKAKDLNAASIALTARKIMAREWARALGGRALESDKASIERKAEEYRKKKAAERERKEIDQQRAHKQRAALEEVLRVFGRNLLKAPEPITLESAEALFKEALSEVGEIIRVAWQSDGCHILVEPWEERRLRRKSGQTVLAVFQATIDDHLNLTLYQRVEDPHVLGETQKDIVSKKILSIFRNSSRQDFSALEDAVAEGGGRVIQSNEVNGGWKIKFEPWEEMRIRNIERKGRPPIVTYVINADKNLHHIRCERIWLARRTS